MAITGIDTIEGKQIIAAGAVSAKSAEMAYNDENGNPITGYLTAVPEGYATTGDLNDLVTSISETYQPTAGMTAYQPAGDYYSASNPSGFISEVPTGTMNESAFGYDSDNKISSYNGSAIGGSTPTYGYTDNGLISAIDASGLYATSALEAESANVVKDHGTLGYDLSSYLTQNTSYFYWMPANSPWTTADYATGIFAPLQYATGACLAMNNPATFKSYYKGNEWFVSNTNNSVGQMLRGEVHKSRGVHISGATTAGYGFDLNISGVSGKNDTANGYNWQLQRGCVSGKGILGEWRYGPEEDAALRAVSSCDMHESAFGYDANDKISGYNGSAFAGGSTLPSAFVVSADGQAYKSVPNVLTGVTGYFYDLGDIEYYTKFSNVQNNVQYTLDTHTYEYMSVYTITGDNKHVYIQAEYTDGDTHSFTLTNYNPNEGDVYVELFTDDYYGGEITLSADGNILKPYALKDEFPQSATEAIGYVTATSANIDSTIDNVSSNSGAWGGSALPISAGPGIKFEMVDNTLVASTDETVLFFAGNDSSGVQAGDLTESIMNFERIRVAGMDNDGHVDVKYIYPAWTKNADNFDATGYEVMLYGANPVDNTVWEKWTRYSFSALTSFNVVLSYEGSYTANTLSDVTNSHKNSVREVIGINRIAGE